MICCIFGEKRVEITDFSPFQIEMISTQIAKQAALLPLQIIEENPTSQTQLFKEILESKHRIASLQLSDAADFGVSIVRNAKINLAKPFRLGLDLKNAFLGLPAVIVGAGPSLEDNGHLIPEGAIVFAGGHGLKKIARVPHFGAIVDKNPFEFENPGFPICTQPRACPCSREMIMFPDSHFPLMAETFDGGWTVGNFMAAVALYFGCNPIVCVGMDYCAREGRKYAFEETKINSQEDWIESVNWLKALEKKYPKTTFFNASNGIPYFKPCKLEDLTFENQPIDQIVQREIHKLNVQSIPFQEDIMLQPLWDIWKHVFSRSGSFTDEQMEIHKELFFQQVRNEYHLLA